MLGRLSFGEAAFVGNSEEFVMLISGETVLIGNQAPIDVLFSGESALTGDPGPFASLFSCETIVTGNSTAPIKMHKKRAKRGTFPSLRSSFITALLFNKRTDHLFFAAFFPAMRPNVKISAKALPPNRLPAWIPPATSPAAYKPGMIAPALSKTWDSVSIRKPPMVW